MWAWVNGLLGDNERRARLLVLMWLASLGVLLIGFGVIVLRAIGR